MSDKLDLYWRRARKRQAFIENKYFAELLKEVQQQFIDFLDAINDRGYDYAKSNIDRIVQVDGIMKVIKKVWKAAAFMEANHIYDELVKRHKEQKRASRNASFALGFDSVADVVDDYFKIYQITKSALPINETSKRYIMDYLFAEVDKGAPLNDAIANFRDLALTSGPHPEKAISIQRTKTIIRTEGIRALSFGQLIGAYMSGVDVDKVWVTCNDERVRGAMRPAKFPHTRLDRNSTSMFGAFNNGEPIKFPGDPEASIGNTINCRCTQFFKPKDIKKPRAERFLKNFLTDFALGFLINLFTPIGEDI